MVEEKEDTQSEEKVEKAAGSKKSNKSLFIVIGIIVFAVAGGIAAYSLLFSGKGGESSQESKHDLKNDPKSALVALDAFVLNLAEQGRFLKVTMQFEITDQAEQPLVAERTPQLRDAIITLMSSKSAETLSSPEGKMQIKDELLLRANQAVGKDVFKNLYFTEFVMQ
ncbi:MAG TPA: flagellar basal body-associated protein FliL [Nitrospirota bacterium]|nr:flagellar basal body-associated protein FliL [Nitrospirota bacterium]